MSVVVRGAAKCYHVVVRVAKCYHVVVRWAKRIVEQAKS